MYVSPGSPLGPVMPRSPLVPFSPLSPFAPWAPLGPVILPPLDATMGGSGTGRSEGGAVTVILVSVRFPSPLPYSP